jgi:adenylate cyclase
MLAAQRDGGIMRRWRSAALSALILLLGLGLRIADPPIVRELQGRFFDLLQQAKPRPYLPVPVRVVDIDDASLAKLGQWPWPRTLLAQLVERLQALHPKAIALDFILAEPDRTSPARALQQLPAPPEDFVHWITSLPDHDQVFARTIATAPVVTGFALTEAGGGRPPALKAGWSLAGDDPALFIPHYGGAVVNLSGIEDAALGNGSLNIVSDRDQISRRVPMIVSYKDKLYPSLAAEALRIAQHAESYTVKASGASGLTSFGKKTGIALIKVGDLVTETDSSGAIWLYDTGPVPQRSIPAWRVLDGSVKPEDVQGSIVFIGIGAAGLGDLKATPLSAAVPGVDVHAQIAEQALLHTFLSRPDWAPGAEMIYLALLGIALILALPRVGAAWSAAFTGIVMAGAFASSWYAFSELRLLFAPVYPTIVALCVYLSASLMNQLDTEAEKRRVRQAFSQYLSPALVEQLAKDPSKLRLGGELRNMTFLFSDIRGFTSIAEQYKSQPEALTDIVNRFMTRMTDAILEREGTIDKFIGDCVMAFWNAPLSQPDHAVKACNAALAMRRQLRELNSELEMEASAAQGSGKDAPAVRLDSGIGINTGDCIVGNIGSKQRFDYSVLGDAVNLAARMETESKNYGVPIIIGEDTAKLADGYATLELDLVAVKGKRELTRIYTLLGDQELGRDPRFVAFRSQHLEMLAAYRAQDWAKARAMIEVCRRFNNELAALYDLYEARIQAADTKWQVQKVAARVEEPSPSLQNAWAELVAASRASDRSPP